jgi:hypothetical protein
VDLAAAILAADQNIGTSLLKVSSREMKVSVLEIPVIF